MYDLDLIYKFTQEASIIALTGTAIGLGEKKFVVNHDFNMPLFSGFRHAVIPPVGPALITGYKGFTSLDADGKETDDSRAKQADAHNLAEYVAASCNVLPEHAAMLDQMRKQLVIAREALKILTTLDGSHNTRTIASEALAGMMCVNG